MYQQESRLRKCPEVDVRGRFVQQEVSRSSYQRTVSGLHIRLPNQVHIMFAK